MTSARESLPSDLSAAHAMILAERTARLEAEAKLVNARAEAALIATYKLEIEFAGGTWLRISGVVDAATLSAAIAALSGKRP